MPSPSFLGEGMIMKIHLKSSVSRSKEQGILPALMRMGSDLKSRPFAFSQVGVLDSFQGHLSLQTSLCFRQVRLSCLVSKYSSLMGLTAPSMGSWGGNRMFITICKSLVNRVLCRFYREEKPIRGTLLSLSQILIFTSIQADLAPLLKHSISHEYSTTR